MRALSLIVASSILLGFLTPPVWARALYLRVAGDDQEGAIFIYHLQEEIPERYRSWIVKLDYGPDGETVVVPNLPDRVYKIDLAEKKKGIRLVVEGREVTGPELEQMIHKVVNETLNPSEPATPLEGKAPLQQKQRPEPGNLWE